MVYGETGVMPFSLDIESRIITYWDVLVKPVYPKLSSLLYSIMLSHFNHTHPVPVRMFEWIKNFRNIFIKCGMCNIWHSHDFVNHKWLSAVIKQKLLDLFLNDWYFSVDNSSKCQIY